MPDAPSEGQGRMSASSQGWLQLCQLRGACRGAPGSEQSPCTPGDSETGQELCHLPGSPLSVPGSSPWCCGEQLWVAGVVGQGRVLLLSEAAA